MLSDMRSEEDFNANEIESDADLLPYGKLPLIGIATGDPVEGFPVQILNPPKTCVLRLPTNDELLTYLRSQRSLYRRLGRGQGQSEDVVNSNADQRLFKACRIDKGPGDSSVEFDDAEARYAISLLTQNRIVSCNREGPAYRIRLDTILSSTVHVVSIPFHRDREEYETSAVRSRDLPNNLEERRYPPEPPCKLYDAVVQEVQGYVGCEAGASGLPIALKTVPPHHKVAVVVALLTAVRSLDPAIGGTDPNP